MSIQLTLLCQYMAGNHESTPRIMRESLTDIHAGIEGLANPGTVITVLSDAKHWASPIFVIMGGAKYLTASGGSGYQSRLAKLAELTGYKVVSDFSDTVMFIKHSPNNTASDQALAAKEYLRENARCLLGYAYESSRYTIEFYNDSKCTIKTTVMGDVKDWCSFEVHATTGDGSRKFVIHTKHGHVLVYSPSYGHRGESSIVLLQTWLMNKFDHYRTLG